MLLIKIQFIKYFFKIYSTEINKYNYLIGFYLRFEILEFYNLISIEQMIRLYLCLK
jgi:hypothetical protein